MPSAIVTFTVTSADTARGEVATTRTVCAPPSSPTPVIADGVPAPSSKLNTISSSSSKILKLADLTPKAGVTPVSVPANTIVSSPSTAVSDTGVTVKSADRPTVSPLAMVTVVVVAETP